MTNDDTFVALQNPRVKKKKRNRKRATSGSNQHNTTLSHRHRFTFRLEPLGGHAMQHPPIAMQRRYLAQTPVPLVGGLLALAHRHRLVDLAVPVGEHGGQRRGARVLQTGVLQR